MITYPVQQGSQEWLDIRKKFNTASEANAMMGTCPHITRTELLDQKKTGIAKEPTNYEKKLFALGHQAEAAARPLAEEIIEDDLYPVVASRGDYLASYDGITMLNDIGFEHKLWNATLAESVNEGIVPDSHVWQLEQQLFVSKADKVLFMVSNGTKDQMAWCWYESDPVKQKQLFDGWARFYKDLETHEVEKKLEGRSLELAPVLNVELQQAFIKNTADDYISFAIQTIESFNTQLTNDQNFADAEIAIKWCKTAEKTLKDSVDRILEANSTVQNLMQSLNDTSKAIRVKRLFLDNKVTERKAALKDEVIKNGEQYIKDHLSSMEIPLTILPPYDFNALISGKKNLKVMQDLVMNEASRVTAEIDLHAEKVIEGVAYIDANSKGYEPLFCNKYALAEQFTGAELEREVRRIIEDEETLKRLNAQHSERMAADPKAKATHDKAAQEVNRLLEQAKNQKSKTENEVLEDPDFISGINLDEMLRFDHRKLSSYLGYREQDAYSPDQAADMVNSMITYLQSIHTKITSEG